MKKIAHVANATLLTAAFLLLISVSSYANPPGAERFGLGIVIGSPTAITGKYWTAGDEAIDAGFSFWGGYWSQLYADYMWHWPGAFGARSKFVSQLSPYVGVGGGLGFWTNRYHCSRFSCGPDRDSGTAIFARVPLGIEWNPNRPPLGVFVELVPSITIIPGTSGFFDIGVGCRYYF